MNDTILKTWVTLTGLMWAARARLEDERGQTAAEYVGILLIAGVLVAAIANSDIDGKVKDFVGSALEKIAQADK